MDTLVRWKESGRWRNALAGLALLAGLIFVPAGVTAQAISTPSQERFVLCNNWCVLVDGNGHRVGNRVFEKLEPFEGGVAIYSRGGKSGAIDRTGSVILKPVHDQIWFLGGRFLVTEDGSVKPSSAANALTAYTYVLFDTNGRQLFRTEGSNISFGYWGGHVYYRTPCNDREAKACGTVFVDAAGTPIARFHDFLGDDSAPLAAASIDGKLFGYIDASLGFTIPPRYLGAQSFKRGVALVRTEAGQGLVGARGRELVQPGKYRDIFPWDETPLIDAFKAGSPNCAIFLRQIGKPIHLPRGFCAEGAENLDALGYAFIKDASGRRGAIDARGRLLIRPSYAGLWGLNRDHLIFGNNPYEPTQTGVINVHGKVILALQPVKLAPYSAGCCSNPGILQNALIGVAADGKGLGLLGLDGHWIIPAQYKEARVISASLVALRDRSDLYRFFYTTGQPIALTSAFDPQWVGPNYARARDYFTFTRHDTQGIHYGLADATGKIMVPANYSEISYAGDDRWAVTTHEGSTERIGLFDSDGNQIAKPQFAEMKKPFEHGAAVFRSADGDSVLVNIEGKVLTSFNQLLPDLAKRGESDETIEGALDICFDPDPAAEPEEKRSRQSAAEHICSDPSLRGRSRETEKAYYSAQTGDCLPDVFLVLRPAYDKAIADCADAPCLAGAMGVFRQQIANAARRCEADSAKIAVARASKSIPAAVKAELTTRLKLYDPDDLEGKDAVPLVFEPLSLGGRNAIRASTQSGAHNDNFWLFLQEGNGSWKTVLSDAAGYLRPLEITGTIRNGMPILRTQQHVSCCEHAINFYAYDGLAYSAIHSCTQLYDEDETPLLFCDALLPVRAGVGDMD